MAWRKGFVYSVSALLSEKGRGFTRLKWVGYMDPEDIRILLAGYTAYAIGMKISYFAAMIDGGMDDFNRAKKLSEQYSTLPDSCTSSEIMKRAEFDTKFWIHKYWPAVEALSKALYVHGRLTGKEAKKIIDSVEGKCFTKMALKKPENL
jgi:hypothetical protein